MNKIFNYLGETVINIIESKYANKKFVVFGDSRTWYDGKTYTNNCKDEWKGKTCIGFQTYLRNYLNINTVNEGVSGENSIQICSRIRNYDFSSCDCILLCGGVNDTSDTIGTLEDIGSSFNTNTVYGAWQSAIEYILTNYPDKKIFVVIPAIAWRNVSDTVFPYDRAEVKKNVAELYNLPYCDLYKTLGINIINRDYYYADNVETTNWHLHFNDYGNEIVGMLLAAYINNN